jgi:hypothetical protein
VDAWLIVGKPEIDELWISAPLVVEDVEGSPTDSDCALLKDDSMLVAGIMGLTVWTVDGMADVVGVAESRLVLVMACAVVDALEAPSQKYGDIPYTASLFWGRRTYWPVGTIGTSHVYDPFPSGV